MKTRHRQLLVLYFCLASLSGLAQNYHGTTGLLQAPSAEMDSTGTFRGRISYLDSGMLPKMPPYGDDKPFNTMCYTIGMTLFPWLEMSYTGVLVKMHRNHKRSEPMGYYNEDRHFNVKIRPLKEGKWWPAIAAGWDDFGSFKWLKINTSITGNNHFEHLYLTVTKHFTIRKHVLGAHLAYRYYTSDANKERRGLAGGVTDSPYLGEKLQHPRAWLQRPRVIVEWDGVGVNAGADVLLWRHLFVQAALIHGRGFMGGVGYHYRIKY